MVELIISACHEWVEKFPLGSGYKCMLCGKQITRAREMTISDCIPRHELKTSGWTTLDGRFWNPVTQAWETRKW